MQETDKDKWIVFAGIVGVVLVVLIYTVPLLGAAVFVVGGNGFLIYRHWNWLKRPANIVWLIWLAAFVVALLLLIGRLLPHPQTTGD